LKTSKIDTALYVRQIPRYDCLKKYQKYVVWSWLLPKHF